MTIHPVVQLSFSGMDFPIVCLVDFHTEIGATTSHSDHDVTTDDLEIVQQNHKMKYYSVALNKLNHYWIFGSLNGGLQVRCSSDQHDSQQFMSGGL